VTRTGGIRWPSVAGTFYPDDPAELSELVAELRGAAAGLPGAVVDRTEGRPHPLGILVPHAGLVYSGVVAAAGWAVLGEDPGRPPDTVVVLGTNHVAAGLHGVAVWPTGAWDTPTGVVDIDEDLAASILGLGAPFVADPESHRGEHSIEVQLPILLAVAPHARLVPLAVSTGTGQAAITAGERLGTLLADLRAGGGRVALAISSDMAHYPPADVCEQVTRDHLPLILALDAAGLAAREDGLRGSGMRGVSCGMCGIEPAVLGLSALRAMGAGEGAMLAAATSADAGGPSQRTVGYLAVRFDP
jgi:AmmeMemoRadiSam system protein B